MNAQGYIVSIIQMLQQDFGMYSMITPEEFDILYRWWEKKIPVGVVREGTDDVIRRRQKQGKEKPGIRNLVYTVRKVFSRFQEQTIGGQGRSENPPDSKDRRRNFFAEPPEEIADLVSVLKDENPDTQRIDSFWAALLKRYENDAELQRRTEIFTEHLAPALRSQSLLDRYRINLLISRFGIPDLENGEL